MWLERNSGVSSNLSVTDFQWRKLRIPSFSLFLIGLVVIRSLRRFMFVSSIDLGRSSFRSVGLRIQSDLLLGNLLKLNLMEVFSRSAEVAMEEL